MEPKTVTSQVRIRSPKEPKPLKCSCGKCPYCRLHAKDARRGAASTPKTE